MTTMTTTTIGASPKQIAFASSLLGQIIGTENVADGIDNATKAGHFVTTKTASAYIDWLMECRKKIAAKEKATTPAKTEFVGPGFYLLDGAIYKVVPSRSSDRNYAMTLTAPGEKKGSWSYARGAMFSLTDQHRLSLDQAKEYGKTHGFCIACGALLTDPKSVEQGIGPICAKKF